MKLRCSTWLMILFSPLWSGMAQAVNEEIAKADQAYAAQNFRLAQTYYQLALRQDSDHAHAQHQLAQVYDLLGDYEQAQRLLDRLHRARLGNASSWLLQGHYALRKADLDVALHAFNQALRHDPQHADARVLQAWVREQLGILESDPD